MAQLLALLRQAFHAPHSAAYRLMESCIWALILLSLVLFGVELWLGPGHAWIEIIQWGDRGVLLLFALEIALRLLTYDPPSLGFYRHSSAGRLGVHLFSRLRYAFTPANLVDLLTVLALVPALRALRALRLLRLLRPVRLFRYANPLQSLLRVIGDHRLLFSLALSVLGASTLLGGLSVFLAEHGENPGFRSLGDGLWWALVTLTTVGYGDLAPITGLGKVLGGAVMVSGLFILAMFAGIVGNTLLRTIMRVSEEQVRMSEYFDHVVICGYSPGARMLLDVLPQELDLGRTPALVFGTGERPKDLPAAFSWVEGDPTKESELDKVRLAQAGSVLVIGSRSLLPQQADAITILTVFTMRAYLARHPDVPRRARPLYLVAEILDAENVDHARAAGAHEVIESTRLGFSLLSHALVAHGSAAVLSQVVRHEAENIYLGRRPAGDDWPVGFGPLRRLLKERTGALLIGLRSPDGRDLINPPDARPVDPADVLIYLADAPRLPPA